MKYVEPRVQTVKSDLTQGLKLIQQGKEFGEYCGKLSRYSDTLRTRPGFDYRQGARIFSFHSF